MTPTEEVDFDRVADLQAKILLGGRWTVPITVERNALFVMDGHHRLAVARRLRLAVMPAVLLGYDAVQVESWRPGETVTPADIFAMARSGRKFPYKTTRHVFHQDLPGCDVPLDSLRCAVPAGHAPSQIASVMP
ncbi:ParB N-terminal domain-containing protein [Leisingera sp. JC1]|uniref:ParB N-terminal domain-containing protein n=1 Tax=Leisingera sp. JC1 TaxID=1855282 RepID=UPI001C2F9D06|nr:ParB N-terminal domain-containing protein [Leisingera sp. JC1]